ncbi:MAG TPA: DHH family phosphoesterase [Bacilli bacterium]
MPKFLLNRWHGWHIVWGFVLLLLLIVILFIYQWEIGAIGLLLCGGVAYYTLAAERAFRKDLQKYIATLTYRIKKAGNEVIQELPLGIVLFSEERTIEWHNPFIAKMLDRESLIGTHLYDIFPDLKNRKEKDDKIEVEIGKRTLQITVKNEERLLFVSDVTEFAKLQKQYDDERPALGIVMLDNLEEATQGLDDQARSIILAKAVGEITDWANRFNLYLRRISNDKFFTIMDKKALTQLERSRFDILDDVRDLTSENRLPLTVSIGIGAGVDGFVELGELAHSSLDIALGRGGDQVAVKWGQKITFYGGRSNAVEKRTRVRARVISHALRDLIRESDKVIIMGHRIPDMDAIGAAIGVLKAAHATGKEGYIVLDDVNPSIYKLMEEIREHDELHKWFITPDHGIQITTPQSLIVVVDTHKASLVSEPKILQLSHRKVVVDHHRRGEEFINEAMLVYMEPYASSTCELVTELLQYIDDRISMDALEATAMLAGIVVDTKSFSLRTGSRTFEAASFLRRNGADSVLIQKMLKEDLDQYMKKAEIIKHAKIVYDHIIIAVAEPNRKYSQLLIAQVADTLLNMNDIMASFVISERLDGLIGISARSLGQINVQVVMEKLDGGGHLTNAATQIEGTLADAESRLREVLDEMYKEEGLFQ